MCVCMCVCVCVCVRTLIQTIFELSVFRSYFTAGRGEIFAHFILFFTALAGDIAGLQVSVSNRRCQGSVYVFLYCGATLGAILSNGES